MSKKRKKAGEDSTYTLFISHCISALHSILLLPISTKGALNDIQQ
jgi:hypothetical protein